MRTPRPPSPSRAGSTLVGNGWLRESPINRGPSWWWAVRSRSALRKCMFLPALDSAEAPLSFRPVVAAPPRPRTPAKDVAPVAEVAPRSRRRPDHDVRMVPAVDPALVRAVLAEQRAADAAPSTWDDPVVLGALLLVAPPIGLAVLWSSRRYGVDARWALTVTTALGMCLVASLVVTVAAAR